MIRFGGIWVIGYNKNLLVYSKQDFSPIDGTWMQTGQDY